MYGSCVFVFSLKVGGIFVGLDGVFYVFIGIGRVFGICWLFKVFIIWGGLIVIIVVFGF